MQIQYILTSNCYENIDGLLTVMIKNGAWLEYKINMLLSWNNTYFCVYYSYNPTSIPSDQLLFIYHLYNNIGNEMAQDEKTITNTRNEMKTPSGTQSQRWKSI